MEQQRGNEKRKKRNTKVSSGLFKGEESVGLFKEIERLEKPRRVLSKRINEIVSTQKSFLAGLKKGVETVEEDIEKKKNSALERKNLASLK